MSVPNQKSKSRLRRTLGFTKWAVLDGGWRQLKTKYYLRHLDARLRGKVSRMPEIACRDDSDTGLIVMCGARHFSMACLAAWTLLRHIAEPLAVTFVSDGTLSNDNGRFLSSRLPGCEIIQSKQVDQLVESVLPRKRFPLLDELRRQNFGGRKLVTMNVVGTSRYRILLDGDVLFYDVPGDIAEAIEVLRQGSSEMFFMRDILCGYPCSAGALEARLGKKVPGNLNAGLMIHRTFCREDFNQLENHLASFDIAWRKHYFIEQAAYAALAAGHGWSYLPASYSIPIPDVSFHPNGAVCSHFAGHGNRHLYYQEALRLAVP
ncbi:hypothetical protein NG895_15755 [Aeoliella sp. ICT_H6.2]|uniref:Uncharacterized protein n=1 Tax=Aeoliella straminimaris TaxID=2954799 RepID=A0A9X2FAF3_9BACT|nr:hypothetical protein [Aeoliella straminimaris]MCO6045365.1 hypothetical protein [Aeoliella straminimaris]